MMKKWIVCLLILVGLGGVAYHKYGAFFSKGQPTTAQAQMPAQSVDVIIASRKNCLFKR